MAAANPRPPIPEPEPIVIDSAMMDRARWLLDAVAGGTFDRCELAPQLDDFLPPQVFVNAPTIVGPLGTPQSMFAFEKRIMADQTSVYFRVRYPKEILTWIVSVDPDNRITGVSLRRGPGNRIFSVVYRDVQY
jgi:hypothetical protein